MPETEKDKLLFKLLPKDGALCEKLEFELLEEGETLEDRRNEIKAGIEKVATGHHYSAGWLMMDLRTLNAEIGRHVKRTQDKEGEIWLTLHMLNRAFDEQMPFLEKLTSRSQNLAEYVVKRAHDVLAKIQKLHPDLHIEFEPEVNRLLEKIYMSAAKKAAEDCGLPREF